MKRWSVLRRMVPIIVALSLALGMVGGMGSPAALAQGGPEGLVSVWTEDFSTPIDPLVYYVEATEGAGVIQDGYFLLTPDDFSHRARIFYMTPQEIHNFSATFSLYLGENPDWGADGAAFIFCPVYDYDPTEGGDLDATCPGGYIVGFDTYEGGSDRIYVAQHNVYNRIVEFVSPNRLADSNWHTMMVVLADGEISVSMDGATVIAPTEIPDFAPFMGYFGFSAATGGEFNIHGVDNIHIEVAEGVYFAPNKYNGVTKPGLTLEYEVTLLNLTGADASFNLAVSGNTWPTTLHAMGGEPISQTPVLDNQEGFIFQVWVEVPAGAVPGDVDEATLTASQVGDPAVADTAYVRTTVLSDQVGYVFSPESNTISLVDPVLHLSTGQTIDTTPWGDFPWVGELSPDGTELYVSLRDSNSLLVVDTASQTPVAAIDVFWSPFAIAFSPDGLYALVAHYWSGSVSVIDTSTQTWVENILTGGSPQAIATSPCLDKAYVIDRYMGLVYIIDAEGLAGTITIPGADQLFDIVISPYGHRAYISDQWGSMIHVIDTASDTWVESWPVGGYYQTGLDITSDGRTLFMTTNDAGTIYRIDALTGEVETIIVTGESSSDRMGWDIEVFPDDFGPYAYASQPESNKVQVLDTSTNRLVGQLNVAASPRGLALFPPSATCLTGVLLAPPEEVRYGWEGDTVVFTQELWNLTGTDQSFNLAAAGNTWQTTLSTANSGVIPAGSSFTFEVFVTVPAGAASGDYDTTSITASATGVSAQSVLTAAVPRPGYVMNPELAVIDVVDTLFHEYTGLSIDTSEYGSWPLQGTLSPDGTLLYASLGDNERVLVVDTATNTPITTVEVGFSPIGIAFSTDGALAFVANRSSGSVTVIETLSHTVVSTIPISNYESSPQDLALNPCTNKIYVADRWGSKVHVIDTMTLTVTQVITGFGGSLFDLVVSPLGDRVYVSSHWQNEIYVIDATTDTWIDTWRTEAYDSQEALGISPDGRMLYVTSNEDGRTYAIDTAAGAQVSTFATGSAGRGGWDIEVFPHDFGPYAYVSAPLLWNNDVGDLKVLNLETNQVAGSIYLGGGPRGLALFPQRTICGAVPTAAFTPTEVTVEAGVGVEFTNLSTGTEPLGYTWDFGDGTAASHETNPTHVFTAAGVYEVTLTVENLFGTDTATGTVTVWEPAVAAFTPSALAVFTGDPVSFSNQSTGTGPLTYAWDFGDGSPVSSEASPTHTFATAGEYVVTLVVTGPYNTDEAQVTITVTQAIFFIYMPQIEN